MSKEVSRAAKLLGVSFVFIVCSWLAHMPLSMFFSLLALGCGIVSVWLMAEAPRR